MHLFHRRALQILSMAFALAATAGCGGSPGEALCNAVCDCFSECPSEALDQCVEPIESAREAAEKAGCGDVYDAYLECAASEYQCSTDTSQLETLCPDERTAVQSCAPKQ